MDDCTIDVNLDIEKVMIHDYPSHPFFEEYDEKYYRYSYNPNQHYLASQETCKLLDPLVFEMQVEIIKIIKNDKQYVDCIIVKHLALFLLCKKEHVDFDGSMLAPPNEYINAYWKRFITFDLYKSFCEKYIGFVPKYNLKTINIIDKRQHTKEILDYVYPINYVRFDFENEYKLTLLEKFLKFF